MITKRIIPCLDVKDGRVVKGVNFLGLSDVSSPLSCCARSISALSPYLPFVESFKVSPFSAIFYFLVFY